MNDIETAPRTRSRPAWRRFLLWSVVAVATSGAMIALTGYWLLVGRYRLPSADIEASQPETTPGTFRVDIEFEGRGRYYLLHVPPGAVATPMPLVIALHGGGSRPKTMPALTGLLDVADREGFLVAVPAGFKGGWNDGRPDSGQPAAAANIDDVGFLRAVVADAAHRTEIDTGRVLATGISNGAMMSVRLACEAPDLIVAVAPVAGTAPAGFGNWCRPSRPVAVIAFLGTADPLVPFEGGVVGTLLGNRGRGRIVSAAALSAFWSKHNGCRSPRPRTPLPDLDGGDHSRVSVETFEGCPPGGEVAVYVIDGGGHTWPGGQQYLSPWLVGHTNRDVGASELMWAFFEAQPVR